MRMRELFEGVMKVIPTVDFEISSITEHTSLANGESVFVCIKGARADGHDLAFRAYENGCRVFVASRPLSLPSDALVLLTDDTRMTLANLACRFYGHPSRKMHLIGITGTKGKTTTAHLLFHILNQNGIPTGYIGTNGVLYQNVQKPLRNTTPDAVTLQKTLCEMLDAGVHTAVIEVSSQALMQKRVDGTHFETALFTNLYTDHIGPMEHPDFEHYKACKHRLFTDFDLQNVIFNDDDPYAAEMVAGSSAPCLLTCSTEKTADFYAADLKETWKNGHLGVTFSLMHKKGAVSVSLPLLGRCNASNALLAASTAIGVFGIPLKNVADALSTASVVGRCECIPLPSGAVAVIDYAHNGESMRQILSALRPYVKGRLICLFGSVGERSQLRRTSIGKAAATLADLCFLTSDNPGREDPDTIIDEIAAAFEGTNTPYWRNPDRKSAILQALEETKNGDVLLLAGKGHEEYQLIGTQKLPFCERVIIEEFCKSTATAGAKR